MNKFVKLSVLALTIIAFFANSCKEDVIDLVPIGETEGSFFKNEEQMQMAVFGIYQKLSFFYTYDPAQGPQLPVSPVYQLPSDDVTMPNGNELENFVGLNDGCFYTNLYYQLAYQLIGRANVVLDKIQTIGDAIYQNKDLKNWHKGEALFLRAYMHINLWNVFGTAPKATERVLNLDDAYLPNSKGTELLDQAIIDLEEAAKLLPASWESKFKGRVTKNSANGLRGKALVFRGTVNKAQADFTAAIAAFNAISGIKLTPKYGANFEYPTGNNEESLFEYQAGNNSKDNNPWLHNDDFAVIGDISHYTGMFNLQPNWIGGRHYSATTPLRNAYEDNDPRKAYNINLASTTTVNIMKYIRNSKEEGWTAYWMGVSSNNPRILRYADVLLLKAEAIVRSGGSLSEAIGLINQIRERARNSAGETPSEVPADRDVTETNRNTVLEWVFQERRLELAFEEGHRWWDLRRRHIAGEIDLKTFNFGSLNGNFQFKDHNVYFPLPGREVVDNINLVQNDGY